MLEACLEAVGVERLLWGSDITMDAGWGKLRYLTHLLSAADLELVKWKNAARVFPPDSFPAD
jgi:predicted TIM-barrel fold metal-dependent hydrolase